MAAESTARSAAFDYRGRVHRTRELMLRAPKAA
jgi:hypothetical protein